MNLVLTIILVLVGLASFIGGVICLILYAKTRKLVFLIIGLLLTFILPGLACCLLLVGWVPNAMMVYGPPPPEIGP